MAIKTAAILLFSSALASTAAANDAPLSAIDWLSNSVEIEAAKPAPSEPQAAALPEDALEIMTRKLQRLDQRALKLIQVAGVLGGELEPGFLAELTGLGDVPARLLYLASEGLLSPVAAGRFAFAHGRIREAAYARLDAGQRRGWHRRIGEALRARMAPGELQQRCF